MAAVRDSWRALWSSRLLVWPAGVDGARLRLRARARRLDPPGLTRGFGWLGDLLAAPAARWDASWYLVIAHYGYRPELGSFTSARTAFFPLYPLGLRAIASFGVPPVLAGVLVSLLALSLALYGIHRLTALELDSARACGERPGAAERRSGSPGGAHHRLRTDGVLPLGGVLEVALPSALGRRVLVRAHGRWAIVGVLGSSRPRRAARAS